MTPLAELIGESPGIVAVREQAGRLLQRQSDRGRLPPLLIQGETGTGKGLLARALHRAGPRAEGPFVDINCAAIPETLLEAELFGYERGAFTDARHAKAGLFQVAHHGTLFLDEVALLPGALQAKLLKAIEDRAVRRLGGTRSEAVDVWILTASNEDLAAAARERRFREDLYHRLAVVTLWLPPLRERDPDVLALAEHFLARACAEYDLRPKTLAPDARAALAAHAWPGNVRELANVMERVALLSETAVVTGAMLGLPGTRAPELPDPSASEAATSLEGALGNVERAHILEALRRTQWNVTHAAADLRISRDTLRYRIAKHDLRPDDAPRPTRRRAAASAAPPSAAAPAGSLTALVPAPPEGLGTGAVRWERRRLAFLRTVLALPPGTDPRVYGNRAVEVLVEKIQSFGGRVEELSPGGIVGVFGLEPIEDAPRRAAHAAMAAQKAAERQVPGETGRVAIKSAIDVRQVLVGAPSSGAPIDLDAKREAWAELEALLAGVEPEAVVASVEAAPFLERHFELLPVTPSEPAGRCGYRLAAGDRPGFGVGRRMATFVGRSKDLELLHDRLALAMEGHGQVVGILGEAGIGKSRLVFEFRQSLQDLRLAQLEGRCHSYGSAIPYLPILQILRRTFRIAEADGSELVSQKVQQTLAEFGINPEESAPYVLQLLGIEARTGELRTLLPSAIKARTFEVLRRMGLNGSRQRPILFVIEDLQWMDTASAECLASLSESLVRAPAMLLTTYRPGYRPPWVDRSYTTQVALQPLSHPDSRSVVHSLLQGQGQVPDQLTTLIVEKAEGNPFFLEELSRTVGDGKDLHTPVAVPDTVQAVLLARVERLADTPKQVLQSASVIGREVPLSLLRAICDASGDLDPHLRELTRLEFLYPQSGETEPVFAFTHALTQEVVYDSLPAAQRRTLHLTAGRALETAYANRLGEVYDRLAYHFGRTDAADTAVKYLTALADKAAGAHAHTEAVRICEEAFGHVDRLASADQDHVRLELALRQAYSLIPLGGFPAIVELLLRHEAVVERLQDPRLGGTYHLLIGRSFLFLGDDGGATRHAGMALAEALRCADDATRGKVHYVLAQRGAMSGRPAEGLEHGRKAVDLLTRIGERWWIGPAHWATGLNHALRGEFAAALASEAEATRLGLEVGDPQVQSSAAWATGVVHATMGDWEGGIAACQRALELSPDPLNTAVALGWLGYAWLERGDAVQAMVPLGQAIQQLRQFHFPQPEGWFTAFLAEAHRVTGQLTTALELGERGLALAARATSLNGVAWAERALGRIAQTQGALEAAEAHLGRALQTFVSMEARHEIARTHLDLAALARLRGDRLAATTHLQEAHRRFRHLDLVKDVARTEALATDLSLRL